MKFRPGINSIRSSWAIIGLAIVAFLVPSLWPIPFLVSGILIALAIVDGINVRQRAAQITVHRSIPAMVGRGRHFQIELTIQRTQALLAKVALKLEAPLECQPRELTDSFWWNDSLQQSLSAQMQIPIRGKHHFGATWVRLASRWQLVEYQRVFPGGDEVRVFPETYFSGEKLLQDAASQMELLDKVSRDRLRGAGTEFESLKEFREGDDPRRIDWRTSARHQRLVVRKYQIERHRDVMIVIDAGRLMAASHREMTKLDAAVDAGLLIARVALEGGDRCGLGVFDQEVIGYVPPRAGKSSMAGIQDQIYATQSRWGESDFSQMFATLQTRQPKRCLMIVISDLLDQESTDRFRGALLQLGQRHVVLFAALKTPLLHDVLKRVPDNLAQGWESALSYRLLKERELALHSLKRSGIHVLDVLPEQIGPKLINEFIELRTRNLL